MERDLLVRGLSTNTHEAYLRAVVGLTKYYDRSPDTLTRDEVQDYLVHLIEDRKLAWGSCSVAVHGLRFFYEVTLGWPRSRFYIPAPKRPAKQPDILSRQEVARLFESTANLKHRTLLMTTYAAGLRVSEVVHLKVSDVHSERQLIRIEAGKGSKDRYTALSASLLSELRRYYRVYRPPLWLFPRQGAPKQPLTRSTPYRVYRAAKARAGITKAGGIQSLRHAFATHLLEAGVDLHSIKELLGHVSIRTTTRYLHLAHASLARDRSAFDLLASQPPPPA
jgi:site-specific recombinase XerD